MNFTFCRSRAREEVLAGNQVVGAALTYRIGNVVHHIRAGAAKVVQRANARGRHEDAHSNSQHFLPCSQEKYDDARPTVALSVAVFNDTSGSDNQPL